MASCNPRLRRSTPWRRIPTRHYLPCSMAGSNSWTIHRQPILPLHPTVILLAGISIRIPMERPILPGGSSNPIADAFSIFSLRNLIKTWIAEALEFFYQVPPSSSTRSARSNSWCCRFSVLLSSGSVYLTVSNRRSVTGSRAISMYSCGFRWRIFSERSRRQIQLNMEAMQLAAGNTDPFFASTNSAYLIFLAIAIVGYFTVPSIAGYIVQAGGHALFSKISALASTYSAMISRGNSHCTGFHAKFKNA